MAKEKNTKEEADKKGDPTVSLLSGYLKANKEDHYGDILEKDFQIPTGSLIFDIETGGGIRPSILRMSGVSGGGKTSCSLSILKNFLDEPIGRRGLYVKAEGRLSREIIERSGVKFVHNPEEWVDGTCYVLKTNIYEVAANLIHDLVKHNPNELSFFFIIDSMDALFPKGDKDKLFEECGKVSGGATLSSHFLRKMSLPFSVGGHICSMISQVRSAISINPYAKADPKQTNASGGNALNHYPDWTLEFQPRYKADLMFDKKDNIIGHWAKIIFRKSPNEKDGKEIRYPIKHNQKSGNSVWKEYEIFDILIAWEMLKKGGAWLTLSDDIHAELTAVCPEFPKMVQGQEKFIETLEANLAATEYLFNKFKKLLAQPV